MKSKKLTLHKSTIRSLSSESLKTFKGGGLTLPGCINLIPAPKPAKPPVQSGHQSCVCANNTGNNPTNGLLCGLIAFPPDLSSFVIC